MEIIDGIEAIGTSLWIPKRKILIIGDLHIGYEEAMSKRGVSIPRMQFREIEKVLEKIFKKAKPDEIIINGDLKHEFGKISNQEWFDTSNLLDILAKHCKKITLIRGNHDTILDPIAKKKKLEIKDYEMIRLGERKAEKGLKKFLKSTLGTSPIAQIAVLHGDKIIETDEIRDSGLLIIGHEHPAIVLKEKDGLKEEKYKCFLLGKWKNKRIIVMPSFLPTIEGTNVKKERLLSPYLQGRIGDFEAFIIGDKIYRFGKIKNL